jgi:hypothetical protein
MKKYEFQMDWYRQLRPSSLKLANLRKWQENLAVNTFRVLQFFKSKRKISVLLQNKKNLMQN